MNKKTYTKKGGNAFYIVLSLCLIAVGVAAWSAVSAFSEFKTQQEDSTPQIESPVQESETPVKSELPKVEYEKPAEKPKTESTEQKTDAPQSFVLPIDNANIIKTFDETNLQYSKTLGDMRLHLGTDFSAETDTAVKAVTSGTVKEIYEDALLGKTVVIDHSGSLIAKYCGLKDELFVAVGDAVEPGSEIGKTGTVPSESADEPHLHFEMYKDGKAVSPLKTMNME